MRIDGKDSLSRKLAVLAALADGKTLERALVAGALPIQNAGKDNAPFKTGTLRRSIHIGGHGDLAPGSGDVTDTSSTPVPDPEIGMHDATIYVGTNVIYAGAQEFGYKGIPAHPYLRPAFDTEADAAKREIADVLTELVRKAAK